MDKQIQFKEIIIEEDMLIGSSMEIIGSLLGEPDRKGHDEWVYVIDKYCFGLIKKRLHLFFFQEKVRDYYLGM
ncbi:hypothetical protein [Epilithonimonas hungarica]|uniref:Uncharacterized protein n=1 Tax=Epilithonimonas hungarica TaxID=454006 RepID=A0A1G7TU57_9FLAO|nr:hypothetical protein [Epilithonimonas hungarica]SDG38886.1 hypothetical protein SAMN05421825_3224 [Epilithonimonas hungarica]